MNLFSIFFNFVKEMAGDYVDSAKDRIIEFSHKIYFYTLVSIINVLIFCFSICALLMKIGNRLDDSSSFYWQNSMSLYTFVAVLSFVSLFCVVIKKNKFSEPTLDDKIKEVIKTHNKVTNKRKKNGRK